MSFFNSIGYVSLAISCMLNPSVDPDCCSRSINRAPRPPKRSTTPTSATSPSTESLPPPSPTTAQTPLPKPLYLCSPFVDAALVVGNFKTIVMQPRHVDVMEWVASNGTCAASVMCCQSLMHWLDELSLRLLHKFELVLWSLDGVLHVSIMSDNECWPPVSEVLARMFAMISVSL